MVERQRMARRALLTIRSDDSDLSQRLGRLDQTGESVSKDAVVVGAE
jgi:hypothetical protein